MPALGARIAYCGVQTVHKNNFLVRKVVKLADCVAGKKNANIKLETRCQEQIFEPLGPCNGESSNNRIPVAYISGYTSLNQIHIKLHVQNAKKFRGKFVSGPNLKTRF